MANKADMSNSAPTESQLTLPLYRVLEDEYMNLFGPLPAEYPWSFFHYHIKDHLALIAQIISSDKSKFTNGLREQLTRLIKEKQIDARQLYESCALSDQGREEQQELSIRLRRMLVSFLNSKLEDDELPLSFEKAQVDEAKRLASHYLPYNNHLLVNRLLLEIAFSPYFKEQINPEILESASPGNGSAESGLKDASETVKSKQTWYEKRRLKAIYSLIHNQQPSALCLSGGGIRSATFNLGILQGLSRKKLIGEFDYLSTVSGGGYIGSWLSAWIYRHKRGVKGVMHDLGGKPASALEPDPPEISYLRTYSNYLSPQTGLLSADTWTLAATVIRNLFLNWLVFIPLMMAVLMLLRLYIAATLHQMHVLWQPWILGIGFSLALVGVSYIGLYLPSRDDRSSNQNRFLVLCLTPLVLAAIAVTFFWACYNHGPAWPGWKRYFGVETPRSIMIAFMVLVTALIFYGWVLYVLSRRRTILRYVSDPFRNKNMAWKLIGYFLIAFGVIVAAGIVTGYIIWRISNYFGHDFIFGLGNDPDYAHTRTYVCFAVPLLLAFLTLGATLLVGLTSSYNSDEEREWFARLSGWLLIVIVGWVVITGLVLSSADLADNSWNFTNIETSPLLKSLAAAIGLLSGIITVLGGFSARTKAYLQKEDNTSIPKEEKAGLVATVRRRLPTIAAPLFFIFLVIVLSLATNVLLVVLYRFLSNVLPGFNLAYGDQPLASPMKAFLPGMDLAFHQVDFTTLTTHRAIVLHSGFSLLLVTTIALGLFGWLMGLMIDTGRFSIHSMYSNRLKRAYLGASRRRRSPNWFTNFDSADDLNMHELRPALFNEKSFTDLPGFISELNNNRDQLSNDLRDRLSETTKNLMQTYKPTDEPSRQLVNSLVSDLNNILLDGDCIYVEERYPEPKKKIIKQMMKQELQGEGRVLLNRLYLEEAYPDKIERIVDKLRDKNLSRPLPVINMALNLMRGDKLAWQERKAEPFTVSPFHSGNHLLGYRRSRYYGGENGISLGMAFTISGAAASPNMGYMLSSPLVSFLMAMFNVRLGWWLGNPGPAGNGVVKRDSPNFMVGPIVSEALSMANDKRKYVYLSDGGHFENLGLYEMVLRRCHLIVVSDASTDPEYKFESLGMALRKIRIDLGIPVEFRDFKIHNNSPTKETRYVAIADIRYSCVDDDPCQDDDDACQNQVDGILVYIKASLAGDEPRDVLHYQQENRKFPQEFIGDQWFSESQFESYRALGSHIIESISGKINKNEKAMNLDAFYKRVRKYMDEGPKAHHDAPDSSEHKIQSKTYFSLTRG
jgi:Patatin-like phospholipase